MLSAKETIISCVERVELPRDCKHILSELYDEQTNTFPVQEGVCWDYKRECPFSFSDEYFGGIVRLICAFHNTYGGIIIFGVHDEERTPGHGKVKVNIEKLNNVLRQKLSTPVELTHAQYELPKGQKIDVLLVPKRPMSVPPVRLTDSIGKNKAGVIWMRSGHEVLEPSSLELSFLYGSRNALAEDGLRGGNSITHFLPPSPATLKDFVGRRDALDRLYTWLLMDEEPRIFLYGKGGSGKSTIAYEFARLVSESAEGVATANNRPIDYVLYLSAKRQSLNPFSGKIDVQTSYDFSNADELFRMILELTEWTSTDLSALSSSALVKELSALFDTVQLLLVVDDIDSLTTAGIDPGMDVLYRLVSRSKAGGKILYTLRNAPTQSLSNSIEVPGLKLENEYPAFVLTCAKQFRVPPPSVDEMLGEMAPASERRPLAIETILGLRRTAGSYPDAMRIFQGKDGAEARRYLFQREYDALKDNRSRLLLAALALLGRAASFGELQTVLQFGPEQVKDAIAETLEMFLQTEDLPNDQTGYRLGQATEAFIKEVSPNLTKFDALKASVKYFKSPFLPKNAEMSQITVRVKGMLGARDFEGAYNFLDPRQYSPAITQHPQFNVLRGMTCASHQPPKYAEAREAFKFAVEHGSKDIAGIRSWFWMERNSDFNFSHALAVCDYVVAGKQFTNAEKSEFYGKKGSVLSNAASNAFYGEPEKSFAYQSESIHCLFESYALSLEDPRLDTAKSASMLFDAWRYMLICTGRMLHVDRSDLYLQLDDLLKNYDGASKYKFDILEAAFTDFAIILSKAKGEETKQRNRALLQRIQRHFDKRGGVTFERDASRESVLVAVRRGVEALRGVKVPT